MKIVSINEGNYTIFLNKERDSFNTHNKNELTKHIKDVLQRIKKFYKIDLHGYYEIEVYQDFNYGIIFAMTKISDDYFDLFNKKIELRILCHQKGSFLYEFEDLEQIEDFQKHYDTVYLYQDKYYLLFKNLAPKKSYYQFLEHARIIYGEEKDEILEKGKILFQNKKSSCIMKMEG